MELSLLLVDPLPTGSVRVEAVEFEVCVLLRPTFGRAFIAVGSTSKVDNLLLTNCLYFELQNLIDTRALLSAISYAAAPKRHAIELEIVFVCLFEFFDGR